MKTLLGLIIIMLSVTATAKPNHKQLQIGYLVCIDSGKKITIDKTTEISEVYAAVELCFPGNCINIEKQLYRTEKPVFEMSAGDFGIYVEMKILKRVKKNGNLVLRRYKTWK